MTAGGGAQRPAPGGAHLVIRGLRKTFGDRPVLTGFDLEVRRGECAVVLGANGSGKSTALRCVVGLQQADAGEITIGGTGAHELRGRARERWRREVAMIFQQIHLVRRRSAVDNVCAGALGRLTLLESFSALAFPASLRSEAMTCLQRVDLADHAADRVGRLSGGQQQRVAIARALCQRASVVLADEPVAALDPAAAEQVMALLRDLAHEEDLAVCAVLHQPDLARRHADRLIGLHGGTVIFDAPPADVSDVEVAALYAHEQPVAVV